MNRGHLCSLGTSVFALVLGFSATSSAASTIISVRNSSDPRARVFDGKLYLYTSSDLNQSGNWPMDHTYVYTLTNSADDPGLAASWTDGGAVLAESAYEWSVKQRHLWAPDAFQDNDGKYYLAVPDTFNSAGDSRIGLSVGSSPTGPFGPPSGFTSSTNYITGGTSYMSDPSVFIDPNDANHQAYLVYADGDYNSSNHGCGQITIAKLDPSKATVTGGQQVQWTNASSIPSSGGCTPAYMEGAELAYFGGPGMDGDGKYFLYFAIKDNGSYSESIAYATADSPMGKYTYQGMIMSGQGGAGWTNQASIVEWQGHYLFFYHNDPRGMANPNRQVFLECVGIQNGKIGTAVRGSYTKLSSCPVAKTGSSGTGGTSATGGTSGTGGSTTVGSGGTSQIGSGGTSQIGSGGTSQIGSGGVSSTTGSPVGGTTATSTTGASTLGGSTSGSSVAATGGNTGTTSAGASAGGHSSSTGGASLGGLSSASGGKASGGDSDTTAGGAAEQSDDQQSDGCGCRIAETTKRSAATGVFALGGLAILSWVRRRRRSV